LSGAAPAEESVATEERPDWAWVLPGQSPSPAEAIPRIAALCQAWSDPYLALFTVLATHQGLPREVLADPAVPMRRDTIRPLGATPAMPSPSAIEETAALIARARSPLIITSGLGRSPDAVEALSLLCDDHAIPVIQVAATI